MHTEIRSESLEGKRPLGRLTYRGDDYIRMDNKWGECGMDSSGSGYKLAVGSSEHRNEYLGSIKGGQYFDHLTRLLSSQGQCSMVLVLKFLSRFIKL
jgi:hypothetical protein